MDEELSFKISADTGDAVKEINSLISSLKYLKKNSKEDFGFGNLATQINSFTAATKDSVEPIVKMANGLKDIASSIKAIDVKKLGKVASAVKPQNVGGSQQKPSGEMTSVDEGVASVKSIAQANNETGHWYENLKNSLTTLKENLKVTNKWGKAFSKIGNIVMYRILRRGLAIIRDSIKDGIENVAKYSAALKGLDSNNANGVMSELATSFLQLKNALGSAIIPLLQQLKPLIISVVNGIIRATNTINQIASAVNGNDTFTKAKYVWVDYAKSIDKATKSAKGYKNTILGIDEINPLNGTNESGSDSSVSDMFEESTIEEPMKTIGTRLKELFSKVVEHIQPILDKVKEIGKTIGDWLLSEDFLNALDWLSEHMDVIADAVLVISAIAIGGKVLGFFKDLGKEGAAVGILAVGIEHIVTALQELDQQTEPSVKSLTKLAGGYSMVGGAISVLTGSWIPLLIGVIAGASASISQQGKEFRERVYYGLTRWFDEDIGKSLSDFQEKISSKLGSGFGDWLTHLRNFGATVWDLVMELGLGVFTWLVDIFTMIGDSVTGKWNDVLTDLKNFGIDILNVFIGTAEALVNGIIRGINICIRTLNGFKIDIPQWLQDLTGMTSFGFSIAEIKEVSWKIDSKSAAENLAKATGGSSANSTTTNKKQLSMVSLKANGGWVDAGSLFVAGESGAEVVGNFGGRTGVMNEQQMAAAYAMANEEQNKLLQEQNALLRAILQKSSNVTISTSTILEGLERTNRRTGKTVVPVG